MIRPSENRPQHRGRSSIRRAIFTRSCARRSDTPAFHCTQCSSDLIPWPRHPSAASSAAIVRTRSAVARLIVPISATVCRSPSRHATSCAGPTDRPTSCPQPYEGGVTTPDGRRGVRCPRLWLCTSVGPEPPLFIFDGDCGFCRKWAAWLHKRVPADTTLVPFQQVGDLATFGLASTDVETASYWIDADGTAHRGASSFACALRGAAFPWGAFAAVLRAPIIRSVAGIAYGMIAATVIACRHRLRTERRWLPRLRTHHSRRGMTASGRSGTHGRQGRR